MSIEESEVRRIAALARLEIADDDVHRVAGQLSSVLDFAAALNELDLEGCEPTAFAPPESPLREDVPDGRRLGVEDVMAGAPAGRDGFIVVPPVVENLEP
jgi:aspartyl-tRNA(Asn)/glutamyl-tRNA(Gln) amidotransferase subunit C